MATSSPLRSFIDVFFDGFGLRFWTSIWILAGLITGILIIEFNTSAGQIHYATIYVWALAFFLFGALIGCIFGVPKAISGQTATPAPASPPAVATTIATTTTPAATNAATPGQQTDPAATVTDSISIEQAVDPVVPSPEKSKTTISGTTNLTEVSDWLTKIVIGAGLVEMKQIPAYVMKIANRMAKDIDVVNVGVFAGVQTFHSNTLCAGVLVYYTCFGLITGYFVMRSIFIDVLEG